MRRVEELLQSILLIVLGLYLFNLHLSDKILYFVHPRYEVLSLISSICLILLGVTISLYKYNQELVATIEENSEILILAIFCILPLFIPISILILPFILFKGTKNRKSDAIFSRITMPLILSIIGLSILLFAPIRPLSSNTVYQRSKDLNNVSNRAKTIKYESEVDTSKYSLLDWVFLINTSKDLNSLVEKEVKFTGFVSSVDSTPDNQFLISRFVISCCAVDARPIGLPVLKNEYDINNDKWIELEGKLVLENNLIVIEPNSIKLIDTPNNPYSY